MNQIGEIMRNQRLKVSINSTDAPPNVGTSYWRTLSGYRRTLSRLSNRKVIRRNARWLLRLTAFPQKDAAFGTFWLHPIFGVIQEDYKFKLSIHGSNKPDEGKVFDSYEEKKERFKNQFEYKNIFIRSIPFLLLLIYLFRSVNKLIQNIKITK